MRFVGPVKPLRFYVHPSLAHLPEGCKYILNLIHWRCVRYKRDFNGFVYLKARYLRRVLGDSYKEFLQMLIKMGVVECDYLVVIGRKCRGYRILPPYRETKLTYCGDETLSRRWWEILAVDHPRLQLHDQLEAWLGELTIDVEKAERIIATLKPKRGSNLSVEDYRLVLREDVKRFATGDLFCVPDRLGRVHTNFTRLKRELRCCVLWNGEPLFPADASACQPLLLGVLVRDYYAKSKMARSRLRKLEFPLGVPNPYAATAKRYVDSARFSPPSAPLSPSTSIPSSFSHPIIPSPSPTTMRQNPEAIGSKGDAETRTRYSSFDDVPQGVGDFIGLAERGSKAFYTPLRRRKQSPRDCKFTVLATLFSPNNPANPRFERMRQKLTLLYPDVMKVVKEIKSRDHSKLACLLQNLEATVMIYWVCARITKEHPDVPLIPVHDAIYTTKEHLDTVRTIMLAEFQLLGVTPSLH
jgi:hypothetical protein